MIRQGRGKHWSWNMDGNGTCQEKWKISPEKIICRNMRWMETKHTGKMESFIGRILTDWWKDVLYMENWRMDGNEPGEGKLTERYARWKSNWRMEMNLAREYRKESSPLAVKHSSHEHWWYFWWDLNLNFHLVRIVFQLHHRFKTLKTT